MRLIFSLHRAVTQLAALILVSYRTLAGSSHVFGHFKDAFATESGFLRHA